MPNSSHTASRQSRAYRTCLSFFRQVSAPLQLTPEFVAPHIQEGKASRCFVCAVTVPPHRARLKMRSFLSRSAGGGHFPMPIAPASSHSNDVGVTALLEGASPPPCRVGRWKRS